MRRENAEAGPSTPRKTKAVETSESESGSEAELVAEAVRKGAALVVKELRLFREAVTEELRGIRRAARSSMADLAGVGIQRWQDLPICQDGLWVGEESEGSEGSESELDSEERQEVDREVGGLTEEAEEAGEKTGTEGKRRVERSVRLEDMETAESETQK